MMHTARHPRLLALAIAAAIACPIANAADVEEAYEQTNTRTAFPTSLGLFNAQILADTVDIETPAGDRDLSSLSLEIELGYPKEWNLELRVPYHENTDPDQAGLGAIELEAKFLFYRPALTGLHAAVYGLAAFPTHDEEIDPDPELVLEGGLALSLDILRGSYIHGSVGYSAEYDGSRDRLLYNVAIDHRLAEPLRLILAVDVNDDLDGPDRVTARLGIAYHTGRNEDGGVHLGLGILAGLNDDSPDFGGIVGLEFRFL